MLPANAAYAYVDESLMEQLYCRDYGYTNICPSDASGDTKLRYYPNGGVYDSSWDDYFTSTQKSQITSKGYFERSLKSEYPGDFFVSSSIDNIFNDNSSRPYNRDGYYFAGWSFNAAGS